MRRAQDFHVEEPGQFSFRRDIHGVADSAGDDLRARGRRRILAGRLTRFPTLDMAPSGDCVGDGAVARATAEIALECRRQIAPLALIERGGGHDQSRRAEAALKALRVQECALHRVKPIRGPKAFDRRDLDAFGSIGRNKAAMDRLSVEMHGARAAISGVAALFHAEEPKLAEKCSKALSSPRRRFESLAID
jgi:hypothetical protein